MTSPNVYEAGPPLDIERDRLRTFDIPTQTSIQAIGQVDPGSVILDIGAGENPGLRNYTQENGAHYVAFDTRREPLLEHVIYTPAAQGDVRSMPFKEESCDVAHARFVLAHFPDKDIRQQIITNAVNAVKPDGKAVFIDYDWTALNGSSAMQALRDLTIEEINLFDASFGSYSLAEISETVDQREDVKELRTTSPLLHDYTPAMALRQITIAGLKRQGAGDALIDEANQIFDAVEAEAQSDNPPGFYMPDIVAVIVVKPKQ